MLKNTFHKGDHITNDISVENKHKACKCCLATSINCEFQNMCINPKSRCQLKVYI